MGNSKKEMAVSIYCLAFNHEKYIRKTLEGFVSQKTDFRYEVIVHDDASTDSTAAIIQEYAQKYPEIIRPVLQKENQYSKRVRIVREFIYPLMRGEYVAACEGDDYWTDPYKLQKQYEIMQQNPSINLCVHKVQIINEDDSPLGASYPACNLQEGLVSAEDFVRLVCTDFFQITSYFWRMDDYRIYMENCPAYVRFSDVGDIPLLLFLGSRTNGVYYLDAEMSAYRSNSISSWNRRQHKNDDRIIAHRDRMINMIDGFDSETCERFHESCQMFKDLEGFSCAVKTKDMKQILSNERFRKRFFKLPVRRQMSLMAHGIIKLLGF